MSRSVRACSCTRARITVRPGGTARVNVMRMPRPRIQSVRALSGSDTGRAAGLAAAAMAANVLGLVFTLVFTRVLGQTDYGSLAALVSAFIILMVPGSALQTTVARELSAAIAGGEP